MVWSDNIHLFGLHSFFVAMCMKSQNHLIQLVQNKLYLSNEDAPFMFESNTTGTINQFSGRGTLLALDESRRTSDITGQLSSSAAIFHSKSSQF